MLLTGSFSAVRGGKERTSARDAGLTNPRKCSEVYYMSTPRNREKASRHLLQQQNRTRTHKERRRPLNAAQSSSSAGEGLPTSCSPWKIVLHITGKGRNIAEILAMPGGEGIEFNPAPLSIKFEPAHCS